MLHAKLAVAAAMTAVCTLSRVGHAQGAPTTGLDLLRTMHDAYRGKWYKSLTFTQKTTQRRPDGTDTVSTWYESLRHTEAKGTELRAGDTISPQIWVDVATKVVVRAILVPVPSAPLMDIRLDGVVRLAGGWLATKCTFYVAGALVQAEEYQDWKADVDLPPGLFDVATWTTAPHWAAQTQKP